MSRFLLAILIVPVVVAHAETVEVQESQGQLLNGHSAPLPYVYEVLRTRYRFENDGTGTKEINARVRIITLAGAEQFPELSLQYKPSKEQLYVHYVQMLRRDGKVVGIQIAPTSNSHGIFRQETSTGLEFWERILPLPSSSPGDAFEYDVETVRYVAETPGNFSAVYSFSPEGVVNEQLEIDVPIDRVMKLKTKPGLQVSVKVENGRRIYSWTSPNQTGDFEGIHGAEGPHQDGVPDVQISSFQSWEEVGRWYADMERIRRAPSPEVRVKAEELTSGLKSDLEKVAALYDFVSRKVNYLNSVSVGIGGYEPHAAGDVLRLGYGDCKDKDTLLAALLEAEGMHASSVLVNPIRLLDPDMPSPWPFTHVITMLNLGKEEIWMDSSSGVLAFRMLPYEVRKKRALVVLPDGASHFQEIPDGSP